VITAKGTSTAITTEKIIMMMQGVVDISESGWKISTLLIFGGMVVVSG
jgi:hypothetical protein